MLSIPPDFARSALDAAPDAMIIVDPAGVIRFANKQASTLFGYAHDEIVGAGIEKLIPERFHAHHVSHRDQYVTNARMRAMGSGLDLFGRRGDGSEFPVEISLSPILDGERTFVAAAIRDVSDRKRVEINLVVAREAAEAARGLADEARQSADRANQGKSRFLATASHDLRQPLQALSLLNGLLRRVVTDPDALEALSQQEQAILAMTKLLNLLLDISKLESGAIKPEFTDFTVAAMFEELRVEFAGIAANKGLRLEIQDSTERVHSDPALVEQIARNLLSNAIKYTRKGSVRLRCMRDGALVHIEVLDTGVGIPADRLPYIYDEFYQIGVSGNSSRDGYGLGLSIVQRLVKLLALKLDVRSEVGKGSTFTLTLPASLGVTAAACAAPATGALHEPQIGRARVLIVEDDAAVRGATRMLLKVEGYRVAAVASLAEALEHVRDAKDIDVLVTDYHLGNAENGIQVIGALRGALGRTLKAVLVTGDTSTVIRQLPQDPYLRLASKPIDAEDLLAILRSLLVA
ncbi:MAG: ATP-binding protein [Steroidobacteraceae bacterium]|jgi:PAS domain S-box-containing protein